MMLRISRISTGHESVTLQLDGSVSGAWVDELRQMAEAILDDAKALVIDCRGVSFSDFQGQRLIRELRARKVTLVNCSPFLESQLRSGSAS